MQSHLHFECWITDTGFLPTNSNLPAPLYCETITYTSRKNSDEKKTTTITISVKNVPGVSKNHRKTTAVYFEIERFAFGRLTRQQVVSAATAAPVHSGARRIVIQARIVRVFEADRLKFDGATGRFRYQRGFWRKNSKINFTIAFTVFLLPVTTCNYRVL